MGWLGLGENKLLSSDTSMLRSMSPRALDHVGLLDQPVWRHAPALSCPRHDQWDDEIQGQRWYEKKLLRTEKALSSRKSKEQLAMLKPFVGLALSLGNVDLELLRQHTLTTVSLDKNPARKKPSPPRHLQTTRAVADSFSPPRSARLLSSDSLNAPSPQSSDNLNAFSAGADIFLASDNSRSTSTDVTSRPTTDSLQPAKSLADIPEDKLLTMQMR